MLVLKSRGNLDLEYDGVDTLGVNGTDDNNLRYVGKTPNNYIYYNCTTSNPNEMNDSTCEKWRIIGLMNNIEDENGNIASRVKIIRDGAIGSKYFGYAWDTSEVTSTNAVSQWGESTYENGDLYEGADIMRELNTEYLNGPSDELGGKWYGGGSDSSGVIIQKYNMPSRILSAYSKSMIQTVKWNIGTKEYGPTKTTAKNMYVFERNTDESKLCNSEQYFCKDNIIRTTTWIGKVALMYPSDFGYATSGGDTTDKDTCLSTTMGNWDDYSLSDCKNNTWMNSLSYEWTLASYGSGYAFYVRSGSIEGNNSYYSSGIRPSLYLKSNVLVVSGDGSSSDPYKLVNPDYEEDFTNVNGYTVLSGDINTVGSVVKIANEEFYVIGQEDSNHIKLFAKYNLNVGNKSVGVADNLQNPSARGYVTSGDTVYGNVLFSSNNYWIDENSSTFKPEYNATDKTHVYVYRNDKMNGEYIALIAQYVDNYVNYLNNHGVNTTGRLISHEEVNSLGCVGNSSSCDSSVSGTAPYWVTQTSYFTGSAGIPTSNDKFDLIWIVLVQNSFALTRYTDASLIAGVRPVIILEK